MIKLLSTIAMALLLAFTSDTTPPEKEYVVKATVAEWQTLLSHPDDVPKNQRDKVVAKFVTQLQTQIVADTIPIKKK